MTHDVVDIVLSFYWVSPSLAEVSNGIGWRHIVAQHHIRADEISCFDGVVGREETNNKETAGEKSLFLVIVAKIFPGNKLFSRVRHCQFMFLKRKLFSKFTFMTFYLYSLL
jgi:hypothetical protein